MIFILDNGVSAKYGQSDRKGTRKEYSREFWKNFAVLSDPHTGKIKKTT